MTRRRTSRSSRPVMAEGRRREVLSVLAKHGLLERVESPIQIRDDVCWGERLADACRELGPVFALFGHYLAQRPDLLPLDDVLALGELVPETYSADEEDLLARLGTELERPPETYFTEIDPTPGHVGFLRVEHRARLRARADEAIGRDVVLRLPRRDRGVDAAAGNESAAELSLLRPAFALVAADAGDLDRLLAGFQTWVGRRLDLSEEARGLRHLAEDLVDTEALTVPEFAPLLCTTGLSVRRDLEGHRLGSAGRDPGKAGAAHRNELVRKLHLADLEQMLVAGEVVRDGQWDELPDGTIALVGGHRERLSASSLPRLWSYLQHAAANRPEDAWMAIRGEVRAVRRGAGERSLRLALRQVVPFRDGGWTERRDTLAELLTLHWRLIHEQGFEPSGSLRALYATVFRAADLGRRLRLDGDPLRGAVEDLRWLANWRRLRALAAPGDVGEALEQNLAGLLEMPQKLNRLLDLATGDGEGMRLSLRLAGERDPRGAKTGGVVAICLALLMAAVVLVAGRLGDLGVAGVAPMLETWIEPVLAVVFLGLGALLLRSIFR